MGSDSSPPKLSDKSINQSLICAHMQPKKSWHSCVRWVNAGNKNTPSMHHPWRQNVTTSMVLIKRSYTKISPRVVNLRDIAGECRRRRSMKLGVVMKYFKWSVLIQFLSEIFVIKKIFGALLTASKQLSHLHAFGCLWTSLIQTWYGDR